MVKYIVLIKIKGTTSEEDKLQKVNMLKDALEGIPAQMPQIKSFEIGVNIPVSNSAADLSFIGVFESKEDLEAYRSHPDYQKGLELISSIKGRTTVAAFEF